MYICKNPYSYKEFFLCPIFKYSKKDRIYSNMGYSNYKLIWGMEAEF